MEEIRDQAVERHDKNAVVEQVSVPRFVRQKQR
jgi:hypothetical protein